MLDVGAEFGLLRERVWMNASHQGPLPLKAADAVAEMVRWKLHPHHLGPAGVFTDLSERLRSTIAQLVGAPSSEIVLANSASYGLHLVANGLELSTGDEVIVAVNDFPSDILPWTRLERYGVVVKALRPQGKVLTAQEIDAVMTDRTRVVCLTWVHSFSGHVIDLDAIGTVCRDNGTLFIVNGSQGVGGIPISVTDHPIDALIGVGHKWLCGPYGTGYCWLDPRTAERLHPMKQYWMTALSTEDLTQGEVDLANFSPAETGQYDIFATANFFNFSALVESVGLINVTGVGRIYEHNQALADRLVQGVDRSLYEVLDRGDPQRMSSIVFLRPLRRSVDEAAAMLKEASVDVARRVGMLRLSPHFYNTFADVDRVFGALNDDPCS